MPSPAGLLSAPPRAWPVCRKKLAGAAWGADEKSVVCRANTALFGHPWRLRHRPGGSAGWRAATVTEPLTKAAECAIIGRGDLLECFEVASQSDIVRWRLRAEECRAAAEQMKDPLARGDLLGVAESYEKMAAVAEARSIKRSE